MKYPFLAGAAVVVLTAALAACGSSAEGNGPQAAGATASAASGPPVAGPSATAREQEPAPDASASATREAPKVPTDRITPATGSFTRKQKEFLTDRVPVGMDPAAVLQTGQETCDKLRYLVKVDRDTAVGSIVTGEIPDAPDAVAHLCTEQQELVDEAALGYADGTHTGKKLRPGSYRSAAPTKDCTWRIEDGSGKALDSGSSDTGKPTRITIPRTARTFTSTGCYAWLPEGDNS
ncbi:hypothetical protein F0344_06050 [Streptomyces finlayi]|uniref:Lipoprotein n=1 Tax=Streptomyces finlayi TaxID=67296 RepID=A0A7G7BFW2_9ACTN|nr:hypothetical protein [Streptomyces finlayi]QNE74227.1 hypothetical protein F0344_06050 [Streptomyces finlayi]